MVNDVTVAEAIKQLRLQLEEAQREGLERSVRFIAKSVEVELDIVFKTEKSTGADARAWFLNVSGAGKVGTERTHKVKLVFEPTDNDGKPALVGDWSEDEEK